MTRGAGSQGANAPCRPMVRVDNAANGVVSVLVSVGPVFVSVEGGRFRHS